MVKVVIDAAVLRELAQAAGAGNGVNVQIAPTTSRVKISQSDAFGEAAIGEIPIQQNQQTEQSTNSFR